VYLARFDGDAGEWSQGAARLRPPGPSGAGRGWSDELARALAAMARIPAATVARRIDLAPSGALAETISLIAPAQAETRVRAAFAHLTRLERAFGGSVSLPLSREEHDGHFAGLPPVRYCSTAEMFHAGGIELACDFRIAPSLDELIRAACAGGFRLVYQLHVRDLEPDLAAVREARRNVARLEELDGVRRPLIDWQDALARGLQSASSLCQEFVAVESPEHAGVLSPILAEQFERRMGRVPQIRPSFAFDEQPLPGHDDPMELGVHTHDLEPLSAAALAGAGLTPANRDVLLAWRPSPDILSLCALETEPASPESDAAVDPPAEGVPDAYGGSEPFGFVSYKRQDLPRIAPIMRLLNQWGVRLWYDRGIPGGAEWDALIEERLAECRFVLLFTSRAAVESRYVRREVKFADALATPVITVALEDAPLKHGMRMLLTQYQMLDAGAPDFSGRLQRAVAQFLGEPN